MKVLLYGLRGVGVETAKNLALQGVGAITLVDTTVSDVKDVGVNFFISESDIGQQRAVVVAPKLRELNSLCVVTVAEALDDVLIKAHSALVVTQVLPLPEMTRLNEFCRSNGISFLYAFSGGVSGTIFVDHGADHVVNDSNGEKPMQKLITDVIRLSDEETLVRYDTPEGQLPISLSTGHFEISEVAGAEGINGMVFPVARNPSDPVKTVRVPFGLGGSKYQGGGLLTEKKVPAPYPMESLAEKLRHPGNVFSEPPSLVLTDLINFGSELQQHVAFYATLSFASQHGRLPTVRNQADSAAVLELARGLLSGGAVALEDFEVDEAFVSRYSQCVGAELQPMSAFMGGVLAQEVVKCTGKFTPIPGFLHFSANEALPSEPPAEADAVPRGLPQDELASVFGWPFVEKLGNLRYFMVGCGALGCEFMKNFALNGVCCGPQGKLVVTDADRIELSNLSRQFLFREHNVGQSKSKAASTMARVMNPRFNVEALELFVGAKSEDTFNDDFWEGLDGVCNALDNMEARLYVDQQCVKYEKSLLESGTMGTSGNVDTICPFKTRTYRDGGNAAEGGGVPMCTLRNFPHLTDHCIEWSRDQFELLFAKLGKSCEAYIADPAAFEAKIRDKAASEPGSAFFDIRSVTSLAKLAANPTIGQAAQLSFDLFHFLFRDRILDLQSAFPADFRMVDPVTKADKGPFWGEKKRYPTVAVFNPADESHVNFVQSATCLFGVMAGLISPKAEGDGGWLKEYRSSEWIVDIVSKLSPPPYVQAPVNTEGMEHAPSLDKGSLDGILETFFADLRGAVVAIDAARPLSFEPADFEKDDDLNFHIAFITAAANLRCDNYSIKRTDFQSCKVIAGKIIAAIATTTAAVCGLVLFEMFKLLQGKDTDSYMNRAIGLAGHSYTSFTAEQPYKFKTYSEQVAPDAADLPEEAWDAMGRVKPEYLTTVVHRAYPEDHSVWDKLAVSGALTLKEFAAWLSAEHGLRLASWDFVYGQKAVEDEENKQKDMRGVSAPVYPPKVVLDYSLVPSLDLTLAQASTAIMKTAAAKPTQQYLALWRECKAAGAIPAQPALAADVITESTTLREILSRMSLLAEQAEASGAIATRAIPSLAGRRFIVIPSSEGPVCTHIESGDDVEHLCAFKILL